MEGVVESASEGLTKGVKAQVDDLFEVPDRHEEKKN